MKTRIVSTIAGVIALSSTMVSAGPATTTAVTTTPSGWDEWLNGKYATGNWGGLRDRLEADGIQFFGYYTTIPAGVVSGGMRQGATYVDDWYFGVNLDLEKLVGWNGAKFTVSGIDRDGLGLTQNYIGSHFDAQQCYGGGQNVFLYGVYLEQKLLNDKVTVKLGRFSASDDFNASPLYGYSLNNAINGDIRAVLFDTQFSAYPFSTWAGSIKVNPTDETYAQVGVFQGGDRLFNSRLNGVNWDITGGDSVFVIGQIGWTPEFNKQAVPGTGDGKQAPELKGLPGHYWLGASYSSYEYAKFNSATEKGTNSYGFYAHADQMVFQEAPGSDQGLTVFTAGCFYPQKEISIMPWQATVGLNYKGLFPGRDDDHTMLHASYGRFSNVYADSVEASGGGRPQYEAVLETGHRFALTKFAYIQPDVQLIMNPAGAHRIQNAVVLGAQIGVTF